MTAFEGYHHYTCSECSAVFHCAVECYPLCSECKRKLCAHDGETKRGWCKKCNADPEQVVGKLQRELAEARREIERLNTLLAGERKINSGMVADNAMTTNVNARLRAALESLDKLHLSHEVDYEDSGRCYDICDACKAKKIIRKVRKGEE
jgi:hypothetical protein